jgi:hypothetical protein
MLDLSTEVTIGGDISNLGFHLDTPIPIAPKEILDVGVTAPGGNIGPAAGEYKAMTVVPAGRLSNRYGLAQDQAIDSHPCLRNHPGRGIRIDAVGDEGTIKSL